LYGEGRYDYSIQMVKTHVANANVDYALATYKDLNFNQEFSASLGAGSASKITIAKANIPAGTDLKAVRSFNFTSSAGTATAEVQPQFTKVNSAGGIDFIVTGIGAANGSGFSGFDIAAADLQLLASTQPTEAARGDFEDVGGDATTDSLAIPEVDLQLRSQAIVAKTRKLKAVWTPELAQDLNAYHSVDAEAELTSMLSEYISMEIDLEILDMLIADAVTQDYWSVTPGEDYNGTGVDESAWAITTFYGTRFEWYQTLVQKIQKVSNEIHRLTLRGGANFVVCGPKIATILESLPGYNKQPSENAASKFAMGVSSVGAVDGRFQVYKNPYMSENLILIGFRGANFLETGAVYAPYVPLIMTPLVYDPSDFTPRKGVMTRYAKKMIRPEFYGKINVADLNLI